MHDVSPRPIGRQILTGQVPLADSSKSSSCQLCATFSTPDNQRENAPKELPRAGDGHSGSTIRQFQRPVKNILRNF
jgi:hypothetical protein